MKKIIWLFVVGAVSLLGCTEQAKDYKVDEVVADWERNGEHSELWLGVTKDCESDRNTGKPNTPTCSVYRQAKTIIGMKMYDRKVR